MMVSLGGAEGEEEDADKMGGMDGGSGEPLTTGRGVHLCRCGGGEAPAVGCVVTSQAQRAVIDGLLQALGRRDAGVGAQSP